MNQPGYIVAQITVKNYQKYITEYGRPLSGMVGRFGGEILVATNQAIALEGSWHGNWTVIIRFPSVDAAQACYNSPDYAPLKENRVSCLATDGNVVVFKGLLAGGVA
jgi:uncharacterized protein (DUF1330 family)